MTFAARLRHTMGDDCGPILVRVEVDDARQRAATGPLVAITVHDRITFMLDGNHADALALALRTAVAEIDARGKSVT